MCHVSRTPSEPSSSRAHAPGLPSLVRAGGGRAGRRRVVPWGRINQEPSERHETVRQAIAAELEEGELTTAELSTLVGIREKDVVGHLEHLERSLPHAAKRLLVVAAECRACGFVFRKRERLSRPSSCPRCRADRIEPPRFRIVAA
jgi:predicted Zn-ribbon and HTH transcriptional regulator